MTENEFASLYNGRKVKVNNTYDAKHKHLIGLVGVVSNNIDYIDGIEYVVVYFDNHVVGQLFFITELDLIKEGPLPLPG